MWVVERDIGGGEGRGGEGGRVHVVSSIAMVGGGRGEATAICIWDTL
jgi:hypothetical protein